jgi:hypothetical protein
MRTCCEMKRENRGKMKEKGREREAGAYCVCSSARTGL